MPVRDVLLAVLIAAVWGANFTVIKIGLAGVPPMLLASLRYLAAAVPAVFFVPRPKAPACLWVVYGLTVGVGQFGALFWAMDRGMPAGLASVVLQSQAFFTLLFAAALLKERIRPPELAGIAVSSAGLVAIALSVSQGATNIPASALLLSLGAAAFWGVSNIVVRRAVEAAEREGASLDMVSLVVWSSLVPPIPLLLLALLLHSPATVARALAEIEAASLFAIAYIAYGSTLLGYGGWSALLGRHPASKVAPYSLLVPVTGLMTAGVVLGEQLTLTQWIGSGCIVAGLVLLSMFRSTQTRKHDEIAAVEIPRPWERRK